MNEEIKFYRQTMDENDLRQKVIDYLDEHKMTRGAFAKELGLAPTTIGNFLNGNKHLTPPHVYKTLEEFFKITRSNFEKNPEVKKRKTFIEPWMIRNLKNFGNTGIGNLSKKRTPEMVVKEFAKFGIDVRVDENEVVWLKGKEND